MYCRLYRKEGHAYLRNPENIWGAGVKSVDVLKSAIRDILSEFFASGDVIECLKSVADLQDIPLTFPITCAFAWPFCLVPHVLLLCHDVFRIDLAWPDGTVCGWQAPYFLHELVSKAIIISMDHGTSITQFRYLISFS